MWNFKKNRKYFLEIINNFSINEHLLQFARIFLIHDHFYEHFLKCINNFFLNSWIFFESMRSFLIWGQFLNSQTFFWTILKKIMNILRISAIFFLFMNIFNTQIVLKSWFWYFKIWTVTIICKHFMTSRTIFNFIFWIHDHFMIC